MSRTPARVLLALAVAFPALLSAAPAQAARECPSYPPGPPRLTLTVKQADNGRGTATRGEQMIAFGYLGKNKCGLGGRPVGLRAYYGKGQAPVYQGEDVTSDSGYYEIRFRATRTADLYSYFSGDPRNLPTTSNKAHIRVR